MKLIYLSFVILLSQNSFAQSAKDYFFPASDKNLSVYEMTFPRSNNVESAETKVYFKNDGDNGLMITQSGGTVRKNGFELSNSTWQQSVKINDLEILAYNGKSMTSDGLRTFDRDGEVIFKIPSRKNKKVEWENPGQKGTMIETHQSEFAKIKINGEKKRAVKVTTILKRKRDGKKQDFYVDYYVEGIGRYQRTTPGNEKIIEILKDQQYEPNLPVLN